MTRRRKRADVLPQPVHDTQTMENALWLMGLAKRPGIVLRLELDAFPVDYRPRARA